MSILLVLIILIVAGVVLWLVNMNASMNPLHITILNVTLPVLVVIWLLLEFKTFRL